MYEGVVSIDTLRNLTKNVIDRELSSNLFIDGLSTEKLEYMIEYLVFRTFLGEELDDIEFKNIEKLISVARKTRLITNGLDELKKKSLSYVLWSAIFDSLWTHGDDARVEIVEEARLANNRGGRRVYERGSKRTINELYQK